MVQQTYEHAQRMGAPRALALCQNFGGSLNFQVGNWQAAERELRDAVKIYRQLSAASGEAISLQKLGVLLTAIGNVDEAMSAFDEGLVVAERSTLRSHAILRLEASIARNRLAAGDLPGAQHWIAVGMETAQRHGNCITCNALLLPEAVRTALALGNVDAADESARSLEQTADQFGSRIWVAMACFARGRVHAAQRSWDKACASFREARAAYHGTEAVYDAARCARAEGRALQASGNEDLAGQAAELLSEAQAVFDRLGAPGIED